MHLLLLGTVAVYLYHVCFHVCESRALCSECVFRRTVEVSSRGRINNNESDRRKMTSFLRKLFYQPIKEAQTSSTMYCLEHVS